MSASFNIKKKPGDFRRRLRSFRCMVRSRYGRLRLYSQTIRFLERRYTNNVSAFYYHYARFRYRYCPGHEGRWGWLAMPFYWLINLILNRDWNQLMHFDHHKPRPVRLDRLPQSGSPASLSIAIVTPSFNQRPFLEQTMRSVLEQDYPQLQYAVVDGGSTDGSNEVIERFRERLAYGVSEPDRGQSDALVKGFAKVTGDIMGYLNSDDLLTRGSLAFVNEFFFRNPKVDVIYGHRIIIDEWGQETGRWVLPPHDEHSLRRVDYIPQETLFWRRAVFEKAGGIDSNFHFAMDWDLILKFMDAGARFERVPYFLGCFRVHATQKTNSLWLTVGEKEVKQLRQRQGIAESEVHAAVFRYRRAAAFYSVANRLGIRH